MRRHVSTVLVIAMMLGLLGCNDTPQVSKDPSENPGQTQTQSTKPSSGENQQTGSTESSLPETLPSVSTQPENTEPIVTGYNDNTFVRVRDYIPDILVELRYSTKNNYTGGVVYDFQDAYLRYGTVKKLIRVQEELEEQGLRLKIWDAFRPSGAQFILWNAFPDDTYVSNPNKKYSSHTMGDTVDVTIVDENGKELNMPSDFDEFSAAGDRDYSDCTAQERENALLLQELMQKHGFSAYQNEWWHFSDTDSYSTDTYFDPAVVSAWYANCNTYLSLRKTPQLNGKELGKVPADATVILLGWCEKFAYVDYRGTQGFVSSEYLKPESQWIPNDVLSIVRETNVYTYEQMQLDIAALAAWYPDLLRVSSIGKSEFGKDLTLLIVGDPNAKYHVLIHASIHAREHMTTWMAMAMTEYWLSRGLAGCEDTCFHIIPMVNPDGVELAQTAQFTDQQLAIYNWDKSHGYTSSNKSVYASTWKANGLGVDLNRNFDAAWKATSSRAKPSSERYKGDSPCSAVEAAALRDYTLQIMPDVTVSCHSTGSVIYYEYGKKQEPNAQSKSLGQAVRAISGYRLVGQGGLDAGGYKDWCIDSLQIPSITIEMGCGACPLPMRELYSVFMRNLRLMPAIAKWVASRN